MSSTIVNLTRMPTRNVKRITRWALEELDSNIPALIVRVKESKSSIHNGRFYPNAREAWPRVWNRDLDGPVPDAARHLILARIPLQPPFAIANIIKRGGPPKFWAQTWEESLVCIIAHEAIHLRQFLHPQEGRPKWSEVEAEWAEYRLLKRWRDDP